MAAKFFTGLPLDGPDPECVRGFGEAALATADAGRGAAPVRGPLAPRPPGDAGPRRRVAACRCPSARGRLIRAGLTVRSVPDRACDQSPLAGFAPPAPR